MTRLFLLSLLALAACSPDAQPVADRTGALPAVPGSRIGDPAVAAAITAPIMSDPGLDQSSNADAIRPPTAPDPVAVPPDALGLPAVPDTLSDAGAAPATNSDCPECRVARTALTLGELAARQRRPGARACAATVRYAAPWADRLPPALPLPPAARLVEAAGSDVPGCSLRLVGIVSRRAPAQLADWYAGRAKAGGFAPEHAADATMHVLSGRRGPAAFAAYLTARPDGGSDVALVSWGG